MIRITISKTYEEIRKKKEALEEINQRRLLAWCRFAIREEAEDFVEYVRSSWLSGQAMQVRTGRTRDSVTPWTNKKGQILVRPGVGIPGTLNYLNRWIGTDKEFMYPAFRSFGTARIGRAIEKNVDRMLDKVAKEMDGAK